jgi:hypothetical protein
VVLESVHNLRKDTEASGGDDIRELRKDFGNKRFLSWGHKVRMREGSLQLDLGHFLHLEMSWIMVEVKVDGRTNRSYYVKELTEGNTFSFGEPLKQK